MNRGMRIYVPFVSKGCESVGIEMV
jgi:hypothetical protein